jgi:hypothetical protein
VSSYAGLHLHAQIPQVIGNNPAGALFLMRQLRVLMEIPAQLGELPGQFPGSNSDFL